MTWTLTDDLDEYLATVEPFLAEDPATETVLLTLARSLRERGADSFGDGRPLMGWWTGPADRAVTAALVQLPTRPLFLSRGPAEAVDGVDELLARHADRIPQIRVSTGQEDAVSAGVLRRTGKAPVPHIRTRLYRLGRVVAPDPLPLGSIGLPADEDLELATEWYGAFCTEIGEPDSPEQLAAQTRERIGRGEIRLWRRPDGVPVAMAALSAPIESMSRISLVYTPKEYRRRGYAGAITAELSRIAVESGIEQILLFTDLANPTSNALYQRIGFQQVSDAVVLAL